MSQSSITISSESISKIFRPLLKDLSIQYVSTKPKHIVISDYESLPIKYRKRVVVGIQIQNITDGQIGYITCSYQKKYDLYIISIVINQLFFSNDDLSLRIKRKKIGIHEFVHCIAFILALAQVSEKSEKLREDIHNAFQKSCNNIFEKLTVVLLKAVNKDNDPTDVSILDYINSDDHYRLNYEAFDDKYSKLYHDLQYSFDLLLESLDFINKEDFFDAAANDNQELVNSYIKELVDSIINEKALDKNLITYRNREFIPRLKDYIEKENRNSKLHPKIKKS